MFPATLLLVALLLPLARPALGQGVTVDFSDRPDVAVEPAALPGAGCETGPAPGTSHPAVLKLTWTAHEGKFIGGNLLRPGGVLLDKPGRYTITARVCLEQLGPECSRLAIRLSDRSRQTWQLAAAITPGEPGWVNVSWTLDTAKPMAGGSKPWGGDNNSTLDLPVRLRGFALPFSQWKTQGGALWVDEVRVSPANG